MKDTPRRQTLDRACEEFMLLADTPDAATLERIIGRYPELAEELTDFAVEWSVQDLQPAGFGAGDEAEGYLDGDWTEHSGPSAVETAMAELRRKLAAEAADPFAEKTPDELQGIAARLGLDKTLIAKLHHRRIRPETVPSRLCQALAGELRITLGALRSHLEAVPVAPAGVSFKADSKPRLGHQESFEEAVERSTLAAAERRRWLDP